MKQNKILSIILYLFIISCAYFAVFSILFLYLKSPVVPVIGIVFVSYIAWNKGTLSGIFLTLLCFMWNSIGFHIFAPEFVQGFPIDAIISFIVFLGTSLLLGYFGKLTRDLKKEIQTRKEAEASLRALQNELEERVESRTLQLEKAKEKLHQAQKMEAIGHLSGCIAHDFNNYLSIIMGYNTLILNKLEENTPVTGFARTVEKTAQTAAVLTSELLTFARKKKYSTQPVNLNDLTNELIPLLTSAATKHITITQNQELQLPVFEGGTDQIKSALLNLGLNACDAMKDGGTITISTKTVQVTSEFCQHYGIRCQEGTYAGVSVADSGTGIEPETIAHIFEPFFTTKEEGKGTGMGLAAVYGIVQSHKGAVFAESEPGKGATFTMLFPVPGSTGKNNRN